MNRTVIATGRRRARRESWLERLPVARIQRPDWAEHGNCHGLPIGVMFGTATAAVRRAVAVCEGCPSRLSCLAAARDAELVDRHHVYGVRGGLPASDRRHVYTGR